MADIIEETIKKYEWYLENMPEASSVERARWSIVLELLLEEQRRISTKEAYCKHEEGEKSALITCPECERVVIINYELYKEHYKKWYCKRCGQKLQ